MKKIFKKVVLCLLSSVMVASALTGCSSSGSKKGMTEDGKVLIEVSTKSKDVSEKEYNTSMDRFAKFEEWYQNEHPNSKGVHIEPHYYNFNVKDYSAMAVGNQLATYYYVPLTEAKGIIEAGYAKDITKWMEKYGYLENMDEKIKANIMRDGKCYLRPSSVYSVGIAVNMSLLKQAGYVSEDGTPYQPKTFEELAEMAGNIAKATGKAGMAFPTMNNVGGWRFTPIAWAYGVEFMKQDENGNWHATFNTPECVEALQWVKDLKWKHNAVPENIFMDFEKERAAFGSGEAAMTFAEGTSSTAFIQSGLKKEEVGFIHLPAGPKRHVTLIGGGYDVFNCNATDEQIDAAFEYLEWVGEGRKLDDKVKEKMEESLRLKSEQGNLIGILNSSPYTDNDPKRAHEIYLNTEKMVNININQVKAYNNQSELEWQAEEPIEAQALYAVLDNALQAVLTDKNADCAKLIEEAYKNFQVTLDTVNNS